MPAIPSLDNALILVTGASGFIASHIIDQLLARGARVRGTVRSHEKGKSLQELFSKARDRFEYVLVEDMQKEDAFDEAVRGVVGIIHTASPVPVHQEKEWIKPTVRGTTDILKSAQKYGSEVRRVVLTSSAGTMIDMSFENHFTYTEEHWNNSVVSQIEQGEKADAVTAYMASKVLAEKAAWEFTQKNQLHYDVVTVHPNSVIGPIINLNAGTMDFGNGNFYNFLVGNEGATTEAAQSTPVFPTVDVRDVALVHIESLIKPAAGGKRIAASEGFHFHQEYLDVVRKDERLLALFPNIVKDNAPPNPDARVNEFDARLSKELLGVRYRPFEETIRDAVRSYAAFAKVKGWTL